MWAVIHACLACAPTLCIPALPGPSSPKGGADQRAPQVCAPWVSIDTIPGKNHSRVRAAVCGMAPWRYAHGARSVRGARARVGAPGRVSRQRRATSRNVA